MGEPWLSELGRIVLRPVQQSAQKAIILADGRIPRFGKGLYTQLNSCITITWQSNSVDSTASLSGTIL